MCNKIAYTRESAIKAKKAIKGMGMYLCSECPGVYHLYTQGKQHKKDSMRAPKGRFDWKKELAREKSEGREIKKWKS